MRVAGDELYWSRATGSAIDDVISHRTPVVVFRNLFCVFEGKIQDIMLLGL